MFKDGSSASLVVFYFLKLLDYGKFCMCSKIVVFFFKMFIIRWTFRPPYIVSMKFYSFVKLLFGLINVLCFFTESSFH